MNASEACKGLTSPLEASEAWAQFPSPRSIHLNHSPPVKGEVWMLTAKALVKLGRGRAALDPFLTESFCELSGLQE
ncbi:MAG: hypothetical protein ABR555_16425 [Pyrinomonadaceae bacterium]